MYKISIEHLKAIKEALVNTNILLSEQIITVEITAIIVANQLQIDTINKNFLIL